MARRTKVIGFDKVVNNLKREVRGIKNRSGKGLIEAAIIVQRDMDKTPPLIPVDTGNLHGSWFTQLLNLPKGKAIIMGFSANYAAFVHENMEKEGKVTWRRPGAGPKFFQASLERNHDKILEAIRSNGQVK